MAGVADTARLVAELSLDAKKFTAGFKQANASLGTFEKRLGKLPGIASRGAAAAGRNLERGFAIGAAAAAGATVWAVNAAIDWESAMAGVNKTIEATPEELAAIEKGLIGISNKTPIAATDLAAIAEAAGALGIAKDDILAFTETVAIIGSTTNVTTDEAATALGQLGNVLKLTGEDYDNFAASLVDLGNKGASTEAQILEITKRAGGSANLIGLAKDATLGWAAAAANLGMNEELAGTSLQNFFIKAMPQFTSGSKTLQQVTGKTAKQLKTAFKKDASGALEGFLADLGKMPKDARLQAVQKMFGKGSGLTRLVLGLADSMDKNLTPSLDTATTAWAENTAATEEAEKRFKTTESQLAILKNNVTNAATTIGTNLLPLVNELASEMTTWISGHQDEIKQFGKDLASGIKSAVTFAKSLDWGKITASLQAGAGFAKGIVSAFLSLPPEVLSLLAGGFVANKFTGGAISGILGEIGKGIIKAGIGSMMVTAGMVNVNGPVAGGGAAAPGAAGAAGGASKLTKVLGIATVVAAAVAVWETQRAVSDASTAQANAIKETLDAGINVKTPQELQTALDGVQQGIRDIKSNPLYVLVQGDALSTLQQMASDIRGQQEKNTLPGFREGERNSAAPARSGTLDKIRGALAATINAQGKAIRDGNMPLAAKLGRKADALRDKLGEEGKKTVAATDRNKTALDGIKAKIAGQKPPTVTVTTDVKVNVTATNVSRAVHVRKRYGTLGASRDANHQTMAQWD